MTTQKSLTIDRLCEFLDTLTGDDITLDEWEDYDDGSRGGGASAEKVGSQYVLCWDWRMEDGAVEMADVEPGPHINDATNNTEIVIVDQSGNPAHRIDVFEEMHKHFFGRINWKEGVANCF